MNVYKLTEQQRNQLVGQTFDGVQFFNTDAKTPEGDYFVSTEVYNMLTLVRANELGIIDWWFTLPLIPYNPVIIER